MNDLTDKLHKTMQIAEMEARKVRKKSKQWYDKHVEERILHPGQLVLLHIHIEGKPLATDLPEPYEVLEKKGTLNYVISTPDRRRKTLLVHINMLRPYVQREKCLGSNIVDNEFNSSQVNVSLAFNLSACNISKGNCELPSCLLQSDEIDVDFTPESDDDLSEKQKFDINHLLCQFDDIFSTKPGLTKIGMHRILVKPDIKPFKCQPYRFYLDKQKVLDAEIEKLIDLGLIQESQSSFASPCMLLDKPDGGVRLIIYFRKLNSQYDCQSFPIARIDDLIDKIGQSKFLTKLDILRLIGNLN